MIVKYFRAKFAQVILGAHDLYSTINQPNYIAMKVDKFYDHPDYEPTQIVNDVALIQLPQAVQYTGKTYIKFLKINFFFLNNDLIHIS